MQRLRHPIRAIREPFGKAGLTVAILALVMALVGGAYAAGGLTKSQEKQVTKIAKKFAGKPGAPGANGTNGSPGAKGDTGAAGSNGTNGTNGTGVTTESFAGAKAPCTVGGITVKSASPDVNVCNGKNGTTGFTKTLPPEESEYGTWATVFGSKNGFGGVAGIAAASASFNIPLSDALTTTGCYTQPQPTTCQVHLIAPNGKELIANAEAEKEEVDQRNPAPCPGTSLAPEAEPGNLCVYIKTGQSFIVVLTETELSTPGGVVFPRMIALAAHEGSPINGSWAVTAP